MEKIKEVTIALMAQQEKRPLWASLDTLKRLELLQTEVGEAIEAVTNDETPEHIISEFGDIGYQFLVICADLDIDPIEAIKMKMARNEEKYKPEVVNGCVTIDEAKAKACTIWRAQGGDDAFFERYLEQQGDSPEHDSPHSRNNG